MNKIIDTIIGNLEEKKRYMANEKRAQSLPKEYSNAYNDIKKYLWTTSGITSIEPLVALADMLEEAAANGKNVTDVTGRDVAAFADELVRDESSYKEQQRQKLNDKLNKK